ncbi:MULTISPECIES: VacJ family lipoprotein [Geobacter]|uniref:VacJ family lipoprotein n=2 Tax=Geobacter TaxID=28231 RepID=Q749Q2_GEOSL|nr:MULTISPECIES: VacJ family lipoprotein [Geobacter]AAR36062.1 VacJ family lipoprotein [Geobacter sulfurreducens PCA]MBE2888059.1 VacJ family lipoprotein [Geobacter anodireducens]UAC03385.1 VacJ family lipoprotein [Geobacter sulfurreducens]HBB68433.1 VacJ family lipoprotein [Geobacter sulfurreducens]HCD95774.1 VacJ family lipoprotein [Geobacter sulfurreducens]
MGTVLARIKLLLVILAALLPAAGCSSLPQAVPAGALPLRTYEDVVKEGMSPMFEVDDSLEGFNRGVYRFNYYFDEFLFRPVVRTYETIMPDYAEERVSSAIDNIGEVGNLANNLLQLKFKAAGITVSRFVINSTVGVAGLWDPAGAWGLRRQPEDFGQTLGRYGVGNGSYLVLPVLGPSNVRDTTGLAVDSAAFTLAGPAAWVDNAAITAAYTGTSAVDRRHRIPFRYRQTGSPFEYELLRMLYTMKREDDVAN